MSRQDVGYGLQREDLEFFVAFATDEEVEVQVLLGEILRKR